MPSGHPRSQPLSKSAYDKASKVAERILTEPPLADVASRLRKVRQALERLHYDLGAGGHRATSPVDR